MRAGASSLLNGRDDPLSTPTCRSAHLRAGASAGPGPASTVPAGEAFAQAVLAWNMASWRGAGSCILPPTWICSARPRGWCRPQRWWRYRWGAAGTGPAPDLDTGRCLGHAHSGPAATDHRTWGMARHDEHHCAGERHGASNDPERRIGLVPEVRAQSPAAGRPVTRRLASRACDHSHAFPPRSKSGGRHSSNATAPINERESNHGLVSHSQQGRWPEPHGRARSLGRNRHSAPPSGPRTAWSPLGTRRSPGQHQEVLCQRRR